MRDKSEESTESAEKDTSLASGEKEVEAKKDTAKKDEKTKPLKAKKGRKKVKKAVPKGNAYILSSYNNTIITLTDLNGDVISWSSAGSSGFRGTRKATPYAAQIAAENAMEKASVYGLESLMIYVKGVGAGREQAIRGIQSQGVEIVGIIDTTPIPHNGCRKKKQRRG